LLRRVFLALLVLLLPGTAWATARADGGTAKVQRKVGGKRAKKLSRYAAVEIYQINTNETLKLRFYDDRGRPVKGWKKRFDKFMRCHQTGAVLNMDPRLARMLYQVARRFPGHRLEVVSGYRHAKVAKNPRSPHKQGLACDFRVAGIPNATLRDYLRKTFDHAGVGYYPNSVFVHLDNRKKGKSAFWIDYAGPGQPAAYAENAREDLRTGRADHRPPPCSTEEGRAEGADDAAQAGLAGKAATPGEVGGERHGKAKVAHKP